NVNNVNKKNALVNAVIINYIRNYSKMLTLFILPVVTSALNTLFLSIILSKKYNLIKISILILI
ncbi:hypothetical protein, partial [Treponema sp. JC4]|uniref:hypothetical protein n=1 Tax=Treponema sp. JC4 TaxID=1124982 RepID=UPI00058653C1